MPGARAAVHRRATALATFALLRARLPSLGGTSHLAHRQSTSLARRPRPPRRPSMRLLALDPSARAAASSLRRCIAGQQVPPSVRRESRRRLCLARRHRPPPRPSSSTRGGTCSRTTPARRRRLSLSRSRRLRQPGERRRRVGRARLRRTARPPRHCPRQAVLDATPSLVLPQAQHPSSRSLRDARRRRRLAKSRPSRAPRARCANSLVNRLSEYCIVPAIAFLSRAFATARSQLALCPAKVGRRSEDHAARMEAWKLFVGVPRLETFVLKELFVRSDRSTSSRALLSGPLCSVLRHLCQPRRCTPPADPHDARAPSSRRNRTRPIAVQRILAALEGALAILGNLQGPADALARPAEAP